MMSSQTRKPVSNSTKKSKTVGNSATKSAKKPLAKTSAMPVADAPENQDEQVEVRIPADARWVRLVRLAAAGVASVLHFSVEEIEDIKLAVAEACNNAILHAQPAGASQNEAVPTILITLIPSRESLEIRVEDQGRITEGMVSPARMPKTSESYADLLPEGGLGLLIIQTVMDEVRYCTGDDKNTTLCMIKYRRMQARKAER